MIRSRDAASVVRRTIDDAPGPRWIWPSRLWKSTQISESYGVFRPSKTPTMTHRSEPALRTFPRSQFANRCATLDGTIASSVPGLNIRPRTSLSVGRISNATGSSTPRTWTFVFVPSRFGVLTRTTSSGEASAFPFASRSTPGSVFSVSIWSGATKDCISDCAPVRITTTFRSETVCVRVFVMPSTRDMITMKTVTTNAMTITVMPVDTFRTNRFRRLYLSGIAIRRPAAGRRRP